LRGAGRDDRHDVRPHKSDKGGRAGQVLDNRGVRKNPRSQSVRSLAVTNVGSLRAERLKIGDHTTPSLDNISVNLCHFGGNFPPGVLTRAQQSSPRKKPLSLFSHKTAI
jgi:hypothetical protein